MALNTTEEAQVRQLIAQQSAILSLASSEPTIIGKLAAAKISLADLSAASVVNDADLLLIRQGTQEKSATKSLFVSPGATETVKGIVELATVAEAQTGTDTARAVTPAGLAASQKQLQSIDYSLAGNALTLKLNPTVLYFRSTTLTSGDPNKVSNSSQITTTISSGSTGGTISGQQSEIAILAINNVGTMELAWCNLSGGINLNETTLINTTAEGGAGGADSATVIYSTTARTGVAFRIVGVFRSTQTTAGIWAQSPSLIQPYGGQALAAMSSIGFGQTWQNVTGSRAVGTTYYNTTGRPIMVWIMSVYSSGIGPTMTINGVAFSAVGGNATSSKVPGVYIVPPGAPYSITGAFEATNGWLELR